MKWITTIHLKNTLKSQKNVPDNGMTTAAVWVTHFTKGRQDGLGSENMVSLKHSGQNLSPVKGNVTTATVECRFPPICSEFALGSLL